MSALDLALASALLFVPGDRPDRFGKARAASPDGIVVDLEDAVPPGRKAAAREHALAFLAAAGEGAPVLLRLNALDQTAGLADLLALAETAARPAGILLAKVEDPRDVELARAHLPPGLPLLAAIETARGLIAAPAIAAALGPGDGLAFGGADLAQNLGAAFAWEPLLPARAALVTAAASRGLPVMDVPHLGIHDTEGLAAEALRARALGFSGKLAIHPAQVAPIRAAFAPGAEEIEWARRVLEAMRAAEGGAATLDGRMIDAPVARAAAAVLERAGRTGDADAG